MKKIIFQSTGFFFSIPMAFTLLAVTFGKFFESQASLIWFLILFIVTLPWSIPLAIAGAVAAFAIPSEWWGKPLWILCVILSVLSAHINGGFILRFFTRKETALNSERRNSADIHCGTDSRKSEES